VNIAHRGLAGEIDDVPDAVQHEERNEHQWGQQKPRRLSLPYVYGDASEAHRMHVIQGKHGVPRVSAARGGVGGRQPR